MRFPKRKPKPRDTRIKTKFLFFPLKIDDETRWLEISSYQQEYIYCSTFTPSKWYNICWVDI